MVNDVDLGVTRAIPVGDSEVLGEERRCPLGERTGEEVGDLVLPVGEQEVCGEDLA